MTAGVGRRRGRRRRLAALFAAAWCAPGDCAVAPCGPRFVAPPKAPDDDATRYNGIGLKACFNASQLPRGPHHVFVISDWGGEGDPPRPVRQKGAARNFTPGVDDCAQQKVAEQMRKRAAKHNPDYVITAGDNFYWGGINTLCGARPYVLVDTHQWGPIFERIYRGPGLDGKQWLGVLGNHDYGGYTFAMGWDQVIGYTWGGPPPNTGRWMTPAQYWHATATYHDFSVDYFFMDTNVFNAFDPHDDPEHNICSLRHSPSQATCGTEGPRSVWDCPFWFRRLWRDQSEWIERRLSESEADWQIIVTHFPPTFGRVGWERLVAQHGVDLIVSGHVHQQEVHYREPGNFLRPTAWIVSGGGGGITSEGTPDLHGADDQYGFFDLSLSKEEIVIEAISHGGQVRSTTKVKPREPAKADVELDVLDARQDVVTVEDRPDTVEAVRRAGQNVSLPAPRGDTRRTERRDLARPPREAALARKPSDGTGGGSLAAAGMRSVSRDLRDLARRIPLDAEQMLMGAGFGALGFLVVALGVFACRASCRSRGCIAMPSGRLDKGRISPRADRGSRGGYSTVPSSCRTKEFSSMNGYESRADVATDTEVDELHEAPDMGCFCWPSRSNTWRYQRLSAV